VVAALAECLFCGIAAGDVPADKVYEDDCVVAFKDVNPQAPVHVLLIPKEHVPSLNEAGEGRRGLLGRLVETATRLAADLGIASSGYRLVVNCGSGAGQTVDHLHFHLLGGRALSWPPG